MVNNVPTDKMSSVGKIGNENSNSSQKTEKQTNVKNQATVSQKENNDKFSNIDKTSLDKAIDKANEALNQHNIRCKFMKNEELEGRLIVQLINEDTNEVVKQIPSEKAISISKNINSMLGMLLDNKI